MKVDNILQKIFTSKTHSKYLEPILNKLCSPRNEIYLSGIDDRAKHFFLSQLSYHVNNIIYVVNNEEEADKACTELSFYINKKVHFLSKKKLILNKPIYSSSSKNELHKTAWLYNSTKTDIIVCEFQSLFEKAIPQETFLQLCINLSVGDNISRNDLISSIIYYGYIKNDFVQKVSEYSPRGSIIDIYSPQYEYPVRIELLGKKIESIRYFSCENQKTLYKTDSITIIPASEIITSKSFSENAINNIRQFSRDNEIRTTMKNYLIRNLENEIRTDHIELLAPFFYDTLDTVFNFLNLDTTLVFKNSDDINVSAEKIENELKDSLTELASKYKIVPKFSSLYVDRSDLLNNLEKYRTIFLNDSPFSDNKFINLNYFHAINLNYKINNYTSPFDVLIDKLNEWTQDKFRIVFICNTYKEFNKIKNLMHDRRIGNIEIIRGNLEYGFISEKLKLVLITENDIYKRKTYKQLHGDVSDVNTAFITTFSELAEGDFIVHKNFGIGIFRGLTELNIQSQKGDFLICEYKGGDRIYVPVDRLNIVQRYIGNGNPPTIHKLSDTTWSNTLKRIHKAVENIAKDLLELYAARKANKGYKFSKADTLYEQFENSFEYEETKDQSKAIDDVITDMETSKCMDRLICGDVGFGKTEVALRAAFKAAMDGKQVALVVPTTLLCFQHFHTFKSRMSTYPLEIEMLSRFKTSTQTEEIIRRLNDGKIDILIGTHKLLAKNIEFKDLGLIVIDEEHKFGVKQKENIRKIKQNVDVLSLSATPIPRTLQMSLVNIRDISLINTPPQGRKEIETFVYKYNEDTIKRAIKTELSRGGAVFFIHNRIEDIQSISRKISELLPEVRYLVTHGRMKESVLEESIQKLKVGEIDLLISTTIVESGIHIPRANTIIVNEANNFGLADLYQLRGRVGRSDQKAYAYFLIPSSNILNDVAKKRLKAISEINELGSGFKLALSDLEIRGAGNLFGTDQSGHINDIGLEMYLDLLNKEIQKYSDHNIADEFEPEIKSFLPSYIPKEYIVDNSERLLFYKRLSSCLSHTEIHDMCNELTDRFGKKPEPLINLINLIIIKLHMKKNNIKKLDHKKNSLVFEFNLNSAIYEMFKPSGIYRQTTKEYITVDYIQSTIADISKKYENYKYLNPEFKH